MLIQDLLDAAGFRTEWLPALDAAGPIEADAVVIDLRLGDSKDGRDVVRRLRRLRPDLPVVVYTGYNAAAPQADLRGLGGPTVRLHKPHDLDDLPLRLAEILAGAGRHSRQQRRGTDRPAKATA